MGRFINPFTDVGFKILFGQKVSKPILLRLLNTLLEGEREITDITFIDKEQPAEYKDDRSLIYDILCETKTGEQIIVEMQNKGQPFFADRCLYYYSQAISRQGEKGADWRYHINAVYLIAFLNFKMDILGDNVRTDVELINKQTGKLFSNKERFIFLQLPYFNKDAKDCETMLDKLLYVIKNMEVMDRMPWAAKDMVFQRLAKIAEVRNLTKEERLQYDQSLKHYRDSINVLEGAKEEGMQQGMKQGIQQGLQQGKSEEKYSVARNLLSLNVPIATISKATGLTEDEIKKLN